MVVNEALFPVQGSRGSSAFPYTKVVSSADVIVNNSIVTVVITDMDFPLEVGKQYEGYIVLFCKSTTAADIRMAFVGPVGMDGSLGATGLDDMGQILTNDVGSITTSEERNSVYVPFAFSNPDNAGTFAVEFAQLVATVTDTTVFKNSLLFIREVVS